MKFDNTVKKTLLSLIMTIVSTTLVVACTVIEDYIGQQQKPETGAYASVEPKNLDDLRQAKLIIFNNTSSPIQPARDVSVEQWRIFRKTQMGWQEFAHKITSMNLYMVEDIDQLIPPNKTNIYRIDELLLIT